MTNTTRESGYTAAIFAVAALALAGCEATGEPVPTEGAASSRLRVWTDAETGCDYLSVTGYPEVLMPRISSDGFHVLCAEQKAAI